jgi:hypothetical protein
VHDAVATDAQGHATVAFEAFHEHRRKRRGSGKIR